MAETDTPEVPAVLDSRERYAALGITWQPDRMRAVVEALSRGIIKREAVKELTDAVDEMERLVRGHDEYNRVNRMLTEENDVLTARATELEAEITAIGKAFAATTA